MKSNSQKSTSRKSPGKKPPLPLDRTMKQLKDALERWQSPAIAAKDASGRRAGGKTGKEPNIDSEWLEETRSLLKQLNRQLTELSR